MFEDGPLETSERQNVGFRFISYHRPLAKHPNLIGAGANCTDSPGGGHSNVKGVSGSSKIHVIRVVFQDQALYARTSFRGENTCKIGKKGVFLVI